MNKRQKIATYFTRTITVVLVIVTFVVLLQSYQFSRHLILEETQRTSTQTSDLIQNLFDTRLSILQIRQDTHVRSPNLQHAIKTRDSLKLDRYFQATDQVDFHHTPDIRMVGSLSQQIWDDGNAYFYGIHPQVLQELLFNISEPNHWHFMVLPSELETVYTLVRKAPIVGNDSGEVMGYYLVLFVVNNNIGLVDHLRQRSNSDDLVLSVDHQALASTLTKGAPYTAEMLFQQAKYADQLKNHTVTHTMLLIGGSASPIHIYAVGRSQNIERLRGNFLYGVLFILIATACLYTGLWKWLQRKVNKEINQLVQFTQTLLNKGGGSVHSFMGSSFVEFDLFGRALEQTFNRLAEQEMQFENLFHSSTSPMLEWQPNGDLIRINPSAKQQFQDGDATWEQLQIELLPHIIDVGGGQHVDEVLTEIQERTYRWSISPVILESRITSVLTQGQDITSIAEAERQSHFARKEAERAATARADFLARMSHEVRTPLNGILGIAQLLKDNTSDKAQLDQVGVLTLCSEHLLAVLNDILDFSKLEQNQLKINPVCFDLYESLSAIEKIYRPLCEEKSLQFMINTNLKPETVVWGDQIRLNQIAFNLLNNAVKFTDTGQIVLSMYCTLTDQGYGQLDMTVQDSGIGIREEDLSVIFEPFIQSEVDTNKAHGGTGLGLSIVKNIVSLMSGDIHVESTLNQGSCFSVSLTMPLGAEHHDRKPNAPEEMMIDLNQLFGTQVPHILLVEDNRTNAFIVTAFFKKYDIPVTWVEDGETAIQQVCDTLHSIDLILMDNQLPGMDGVQTTHVLKQKYQLQTPIYACTADDSEMTRQAFYQAGAEYILVKPIRTKDLHQALNHFKSQQQEQAGYITGRASNHG